MEDPLINGSAATLITTVSADHMTRVRRDADLAALWMRLGSEGIIELHHQLYSKAAEAIRRAEDDGLDSAFVLVGFEDVSAA